MATIPITIISAPLPEGWQGTPDEFRQQVFSTLTFTGSGNFLTGQVGGAVPQSDVGIYVDTKDNSLHVYDADVGGYVPIYSHPIGSLLPYLGTTAPPNYLMCDGEKYLIEKHPDLSALIGHAYKHVGDTDTDTYFRTPNMKGRTIFGAGVGDYNPTEIIGAPSPSQMREILLHAYDGLEWPRRINAKHVGQPAANTSPGDCLVYSGVTGNNYTRSMPPHIGANWIVRAL